MNYEINSESPNKITTVSAILLKASQIKVLLIQKIKIHILCYKLNIKDILVKFTSCE